MGKYSVNLVGESHYQHVIDQLEDGSPIKLIADPDNPHDPRAVKATFRGETIGFVERDSWLTRLMHDDKTAVASRVEKITGGGPGQLKGVVLDVRTGVDAEIALGSRQPQEIAAESAKANPGCGRIALIVVGIVVLLVVVAIIFGPSTEEIAAKKADEAVAAESEAVDVTANQLWSAYDANEAAAQQTYGDRPLRISGVVDGVQLDFSDKPFVTLETGNMFQSVQLKFADASDPAITGLSKGSQITAVCTDISEVVGTPIARNCVIR